MNHDTCKYCGAALSKSKRRIVFACKDCRFKHYVEQDREKYRKVNRKYYQTNKEHFAARYIFRKTNLPQRSKEYTERNRRSVAGRHTHGKTQAKRRGIEWSITKEQHATLLTLPCEYCAGKLNETGSGLDRKDNTKGYTPENSVPCCHSCNRIKCEFLSYDEMKVAIHAVLALRNKRYLRAV